MRKVLAVAAALAVVSVMVLNLRAADEKPKNSVKEVMEKAHKGKPSLYAKVSGGKGSDDDKKELLALYEDLCKNKPEKGDEKSWKDKTGAMVKAAKGIVDGDKKAIGALKTAANCKACHDIHK